MKIIEDVVVCPVCGFDHIHIYQMECQNSGVKGLTLSIESGGIWQWPTGITDTRGFSFSLKCYCESCHHFKHDFLFHEGRILVKTHIYKTKYRGKNADIWRD